MRYGSRSVRVGSRSGNRGALLSSSPNAPGLVGMTGTPSGHAERMLSSGQAMGGAPLTAPSNWISETPVKTTPCIVAVVPCNTGKIGRAHVCTPVTNAHLVCSLLLEKKKNTYRYRTQILQQLPI